MKYSRRYLYSTALLSAKYQKQDHAVTLNYFRALLRKCALIFLALFLLNGSAYAAGSYSWSSIDLLGQPFNMNGGTFLLAPSGKELIIIGNIYDSLGSLKPGFRSISTINGLAVENTLPITPDSEVQSMKAVYDSNDNLYIIWVEIDPSKYAQLLLPPCLTDYGYYYAMRSATIRNGLILDVTDIST